MERFIISIIAIAIILIEILSAFCWHKKYFPLNSENSIYVMNSSRGYLLLGIALTACSLIPSVISIIFIDDILIFCFFYFFVPFCIYFCIVSILEKCVIKTDSLTFYTPPLPPKEIKFYEITNIRHEKEKIPYGLAKKALMGYHNKKLLFSIREREKGYDVLLSLFIQAGKIEPPPVIENFSVTGKTDNFPRKVYSSIVCFVVCALTIGNKGELGFLIIWLFLTLYFLLSVLHALLWEITIDSHMVSIRNSLGNVKTYEISQITEVQEQKNHIVLFAGSEKIAKISKDYENFDLFLERLKQRGIIPHPPKRKPCG